MPDKAVRDAARNMILKTVRTRMDLLGLAAPRKSMNLQMTRFRPYSPLRSLHPGLRWAQAIEPVVQVDAHVRPAAN